MLYLLLIILSLAVIYLLYSVNTLFEAVTTLQEITIKEQKELLDRIEKLKN